MLLLNFSKSFLNILFGPNDLLSLWYSVVETVKTPPLFFLLLTANVFTLSLSAAATLVTAVIKALSEFANFRLCLISVSTRGLVIPLSRVLKNDYCKMLGSHVISTHCLKVIMTFCLISKQPIANSKVLSSESWDVDVNFLHASLALPSSAFACKNLIKPCKN